MTTGARQFATGAVRSPDADGERYDLISPIALRRQAEVCAEGAHKYGDFNWEKGMPIADLLNHGLRHLFLYLAGDRDEDHLGHALWNVAAAIHSEELWPELNAGTLRRTGCKPPEKSGNPGKAAGGHPSSSPAGGGGTVPPEFDTAGANVPDDGNDPDGECVGSVVRPVRFALEPDGESLFSAMLVCPVCGCDRVHLGPVDVAQGHLGVHCDHENVDMMSMDRHKRECGSAVGITFWCEGGARVSIPVRFLSRYDGGKDGNGGLRSG